MSDEDERPAPPGFVAQSPSARTAESATGVTPRDPPAIKARVTGSAGETPTVAVFAEREQDYRDVLNALVGVECVQCITWTALERALAGADIGIAVLPLLARSEYGSLLAFQAAHPLVPSVLITRRDPDNLRRLDGASVANVVFLHTLHEELPAAARAALDGRCFIRVARSIEAAAIDDAELRSTLLRACRLAVPPRTVAALGGLAGWDRRTLYQHWQRALPAPGSPHDFLRWLLLLHAARVRLKHPSWTSVALSLRADRRTLEASAESLFGMRLADIVELYCDDWLAVLDILLGAP